MYRYINIKYNFLKSLMIRNENSKQFFCLKIPNPDATSVGIAKSKFWIPESYFRQINKETKYLTWIWVKIKVWTKKTANKNPLPSVSGCIAFVLGHFEPAANTKRHEMTINLTNLFWQKYLSESAGNCVSGRPGRNKFGGPLVFSGFSLAASPSLCGQNSRRGTA